MLGGFGEGRELAPEEVEMVIGLKQQIEERANQLYEVF